MSSGDHAGKRAIPKGFDYGPRFASPVNSPSYEWRDDTQFLQVTRGCSHNGCRFCTFFKNVPYGKVDLDEVEFYLKFIANGDKNIPVKRVFLQGSNALHLSYDELMEIRELVCKHLPNLESIGSYGRISDLRDKSVEQLRALHEAGYNRLFFGVESADDNLLALMNKGYDSAELYEAGGKLHESGVQWACTIMFGMGGHGYGFGHAEKSADFINFAQPDITGSVSMTLVFDPFTKMYAPLHYAVERGEFVEAGEVERYEEMRAFVERVNADTLFTARHSTLPKGLIAALPDQRDEALAAIDKIIGEADEVEFKHMRMHVPKV
ncbi:MAG: radical SAM protein [Eggerthellaceae bacterium]|nr:radical SAM protein [Eggerthellaceae bacterium]